MKFSTISVFEVSISFVSFLFPSNSIAEKRDKIDPSQYFIKAKRIDGNLNEPEWNLAQPISNFTQLELEEGMLASESTEVLILYADRNLYLGIKCFDTQPEKIVANVMCRDADLSKNDMAGISSMERF